MIYFSVLDPSKNAKQVSSHLGPGPGLSSGPEQGRPGTHEQQGPNTTGSSPRY